LLGLPRHGPASGPKLAPATPLGEAHSLPGQKLLQLMGRPRPHGSSTCFVPPSKCHVLVGRLIKADGRSPRDSALGPKCQFAAVPRYGRCRWNTGRSVDVADTAGLDPSRSSAMIFRCNAHCSFSIRVRAAPDPRIRARRCRRGCCLRLAGVRTPSILEKFVKVLEQRKPKGVPRRNRRHFLRPLDPTAWFRTPFLSLLRSSGGIWKMPSWT
jgi:hypothetical protein